MTDTDTSSDHLPDARDQRQVKDPAGPSSVLQVSAPDIAVICNPKSGQPGPGHVAIARVLAALGPRARATHPRKGRMIASEARAAAANGARLLVAAGGDGTIMAVASVAAETGLPMAVIPLGTFNFFARGLGIPSDPVQAARLVTEGEVLEMPLSRINGQAFLNNASVGIYPAILQMREGMYRRWGRRRIAAYTSVIQTFARFQRPMKVEIVVDGETLSRRTPLLFVARSAYQLQTYGLPGVEEVRRGDLALLIAPDQGHIGLLRQAWRLMRRSLEAGRDYELVTGRHITIRSSRRRRLVGCDGERFRMTAPLVLSFDGAPLRVIVPAGQGAG